MKRSQILIVFCLSLGMILLLSACGEATATPTSPPVDTAVAAETIAPTDPPATDTPEPTETAVPTDTPVEPTATATEPPPSPTPEPTETAVPETVDYEITVTEPAAGAELIVGQEVTFSGQIDPPPTESFVIAVMVGGIEAMTGMVDADPTTGEWSFTAELLPLATGPGELIVSVTPEVELRQEAVLVFDPASEDPFVTLSRPESVETAVSGRVFFFAGDSQNLIDDTLTIGVLVEDCTTFAAAQSFDLSGGRWYGLIILPEDLESGPACAIAYTGEYESDAWRGALTPINIVPPTDPAANLLVLGNPGEIPFRVGEGTSLFGAGINPERNEVEIRLASDEAGAASELIASGKAFPDQFGYWEIELEVPEGASSGLALLTISMGSDEDYREVRQNVIVAP